MSAAPKAFSEPDIVAPLTFIVPQATKPYFESAALTGGEAKIHFEIEQHDVTVHNARKHAGRFSLDKEGFELHRHATQVADLYDDAAIKSQYEDELKALLKGITGCDYVGVFDYTRRSDSPEGAPNPDGQRGPADRVHVDYTPVSGPIRAADALGRDEVDRVLNGGGRIVQINVWRPISGPVQRAPLALGAAHSIGKAELIATDQRFPERTGEIFYLSYAPTQRWYWAPLMERDEVFLIKGWDSLDDGRAIFTPHGAFKLPEQDESAPARESIEARTYVIFEPK
jgi:hypothetical protein